MSAEQRIRIVFFVGQDIGYRLAEFVAARSDIDPLFISTRTKRDAINGYRSAIELCAEKNLRCLDAHKVDEATIRAIAEHNPELIVSAYYPVKIPQQALDCARRGAINVHPGILPRYRGRFPTPWYILNGEREFGIAIHQIDAGIDTGDVLLQRTYPISEDETGYSLYRNAMDKAGTLLIEQFDNIIDGKLKPVRQSGTGSYYKSIERRFHIDWNRSCEEIARRVRVHARPYFPAFSYLFNRIVLIDKVSPAVEQDFTPQGGGEIVSVSDDGTFVVSCADGCLRVSAYSIAPELTPEERLLHIRVGNRLD